MRGARLGALAAHGAQARVAHGDLELHEVREALVALERAHHELAALREVALAVARGLGADRRLEVALDLVEALGVVGDLLGHRLGARERGVGARDQALR